MDALWIVLAAVGISLSIAATLWATRFVATLPVDWFHRVPVGTRRGRQTLGIALIAVGVAMLVLPGPGTLVLIAGLSLTDIPGKQALILNILRRPAVRQTYDRVRAAWGHPPITLPA